MFPSLEDNMGISELQIKQMLMSNQRSIINPYGKQSLLISGFSNTPAPLYGMPNPQSKYNSYMINQQSKLDYNYPEESQLGDNKLCNFNDDRIDENKPSRMFDSKIVSLHPKFFNYQTITLPYGIIYWGNIKNGKREGYGALYDKDCNKIFEGEWVNDCREGRGTAYNQDNTKYYRGYWKNNLRHGSGILYKAGTNQKQYDGGWVKNHMEGQGNSYHPNGNIKFKGQFKNNKIVDTGVHYNLKGEIITMEGAPTMDNLEK